VSPSEPSYAPALLGVINLSPESMVKDSIAAGADAALERAKRLREHGVSVLDVGGRSITPDAPRIDDAQEQARLEVVLPRLVQEGFRISVDTWSPDTARRALDWGAALVNYTRSELPDELLDQIASTGAALGITYMPYGDAYRMRTAERVPYRMDAIVEFLAPRVEHARAAGVCEIVVDPNLGILHPDTDDYTKTHLQLEVLASIERIRELGCPVLLYAARKPERLARILIAEAVLRARPEYVRTHEPEIITRLLAAAREAAR
jgi:dihydropteroate synthase